LHYYFFRSGGIVRLGTAEWGFFAFCSDFGFLDWFSCWFSRAVSFSCFGTRAFLEELIQCGMTGGGLGWIGFWIGLQFFFFSVLLDLQMSTQVLTPEFPSAIGTGAYTADGCTWFLVALCSLIFLPVPYYDHAMT